VKCSRHQSCNRSKTCCIKYIRQGAGRLAYRWLSGVSARLLPSQQPEACHMHQTAPALWTL